MFKVQKYNSNSVEETHKIAAEVFGMIREGGFDKPVVILLQGEMGAGKTHFVQGLAKAMGIGEKVVSSTFVLERQYTVDSRQQTVDSRQQTVDSRPAFVDLSSLQLRQGSTSAGEQRTVDGDSSLLEGQKRLASSQKAKPITQNSKLKTLYHYDLWRIKDIPADELLENLGLDEALKPDNVIAIEWPENVEGLREQLENEEVVLFELRFEIAGEQRRVLVTPDSLRYQRKMEKGR